MKIELIERNYDIGKRLTTLIKEKLEKLDRYFEDDAVAKVVCSLQNRTYKMELTVASKKLIYRAEVIGENMYENIDNVLPKIERQIIKQGEKRRAHFKKSAFDFADYLYLEEAPEKEDKKEIYKKKSFELDPMTVEEAELNLEAVEHDFYVFLNAETGKVNVLYKRKDDKLGLIECNY